MVADAAERHFFQAQPDARPRLRIAAAPGVATQKFEERRVGKLGGALQPAVDRIERADQLFAQAVEVGEAGARSVGRRAPGLPQAVEEDRAVLRDPARLLAKHPRHLAQHGDEAGPAEFVLLRKVRAAPERLALGGQKHGERPAAALAQGLERAHVDVVDIGPFLAVDLDVDKQLVHRRGGIRVLKTLMRHDMAPVAGGIAH
jgi:hypothetical protein